MPNGKRGGKWAVSRKLVVLVVVLVLLAVAVIYAVSNKGLSEAEKAVLRGQCVNSFQDKTYSFSSVEQCDGAGLWASALAQCKAWVTGDDVYCEDLIDRDAVWCVAKAFKDPDECEPLDETEIEYCKAFVTKDPALCDSIVDERAEFNCVVTVKGDLSQVEANTADLCGAELEPK